MSEPTTPTLPSPGATETATDRPDDAAAPRLTPPFAPRTERMIMRMHRPLMRMWAHGFRFLFVLDALVLLVLMVAINLVRFGQTWPNSVRFYVVGFLIATAIHVTINYLAGLYEREPRLGVRPWLPRVVFATAIGLATQALGSLLLDRYLMPRWNLIVFGALAIFALSANRWLSRSLLDARLGPPRVVLVGTADAIERASAHLLDSDRDAVAVGTARTPDGLVELVQRVGATDVLLLDVGALESVFPEPVSTLDRAGVGFLQRVSATETLLGLQSVRQVAGMPFVRLRVHTIPSHQVRLKRMLDLAMVLATSVVWVPVLALLSCYVLAGAGRPIFYRQVRIGRDGRLFRVAKFRTMIPDAEHGGAVLATKNDGRVVRGLGWMRDTRADELPQMLNVLVGTMSLVGPRPERPELAEAIELEVPGYARRLELPPGLTGLAQVYGRYSTSAEFKLGYDLQYLANWSPVLDLQILLRTVWVVLSRRV